MAAVDSLLSLAHRDGADEVRLGTDRAPAMFSAGAPKRLSMPKTPDDMLRTLLGGILEGDVEARLRESGRADTTHTLAGVGAYRVVLSKRGDGGIEVVFTLTGKVSAPAATAPARAAQAAEVHAPVVTSTPPTASIAPSAPSTVETPKLDAIPGEPSEELLSLLVRAHLMGASDLHLSTGEPPALRAHGLLSTLTEDGPLDVASMLGGLLDARAQALLAQGRSFDFVITLPEEPLGPRVALRVFEATCTVRRTASRSRCVSCRLRRPRSMHSLTAGS